MRPPAVEIVSQEDTMTGRPRAAESERRRREFLRLVAAGADFDAAAREARIKPARALKLLSHPDVRQLLTKAA